MNVKENDLAIVVAGDPPNLGTLVEVLRLEEIDHGMPWWVCNLLSGAPRVFDQRFKYTDTPAQPQLPGTKVLIADIILRPLRGDLRGEEYGNQSSTDLTKRQPAERV